MITNQSTVVHEHVMKKWIEELENIFPNTEDHMIEGRWPQARKLLTKIYDAGLTDGEMLAYAKREI